MKNRLEKLKKLKWTEALALIIKKSNQDNIGIHAASLTYTTVLSFIPIVAMAYFVFDVLGGMDKVQGNIETFIGENLAPNFADQIMGFIHGVREKISTKAMGAFGVIGFIFAGIALLSKIEVSLNLIWGKKRGRPWIQKTTTFWTIISLGPVFIGTSVLLTTEGLMWLKSDRGEIARLLVYVSQFIPYVTSSALITMIYLWLPAHKIKLRNAMIAGTAAGFIFEVAKQIYAVYAIRAIKSSIYGSLAVAPVFLLWLNFIWLIFMFGAEICYYLNEKPTKVESLT